MNGDGYSERMDRVVMLTRDLVQIPSTESRPAERARAFRTCRNHLEAVPGVEIHESECGGFGSMVAVPNGVERPEVMLVGHLDVVDHPDVAVFRSEIRDGRIIGPGAGDMKGQCAILLDLFTGLLRAHPGLSIGLALTSDEERGGENGVRHLFEDLGWRCGIAIVPDGGSMNDITVAEKGILHLRFRAEGRESHAARPWLVPNSLMMMHGALGRLHDHFSSLALTDSEDHWYPTFVPTIMRTQNEMVNCIPGEVEAFADLRFPPPETVSGMMEKVRELTGPEVEVEVLVGAESSELDPDPLYLRVTEELTGKSVRQVRASGGSDARFIAAHGIPVILSRPLVGNLHSADEWIDIEAMGLHHRICESYVLQKLGVV